MLGQSLVKSIIFNYLIVKGQCYKSNFDQIKYLLTGTPKLYFHVLKNGVVIADIHFIQNPAKRLIT